MHSAHNRKVEGSIPSGLIVCFLLHLLWGIWSSWFKAPILKIGTPKES